MPCLWVWQENRGKKMNKQITLDKDGELWLLKTKNLNNQETWDALLKVTLGFGKAVGFSESDLMTNFLNGLTEYEDLTSHEVKKYE